MRTLVLKFGGASLSCPEQFSKISDLILKKKLAYSRLVVVVSAMANMTDQLIELAKTVHPSPPQRELDMLISIGERASMSLLSMALQAKGALAISFTGSQSGIVTSTKHTEARILDVQPSRLIHFLNLGYIVIVAGFQGVSQEREITTLGRGGSDTSAVAIGVALEAERVEFFKDVGGIYAEDPKRNKDAKHFSFLTYQDALKIIDPKHPVLHPRCIELAQSNELPLSVRSFEHEGSQTNIQSKTPLLLKNKIYELA